MSALRARKAQLGDAGDIHDLVNLFAQRGDMLPRTMGEVYENLRDFFVLREPASAGAPASAGRPGGGSEAGTFLGCVALHVMWSDLAEIKSLAVPEAAQGRGLGSVLVEACIVEARQIGLQKLFALTYRPAFFERLGFEIADVMNLPRKVWNECYRCPKFPSCNEIALTLDLSSRPLLLRQAQDERGQALGERGQGQDERELRAEAP